MAKTLLLLHIVRKAKQAVSNKINAEEYIPHLRRYRSVIIVILGLAYIGLAVYFNVVLRSGVLYTHFAYLPIVLASIWWGKKGVLFAAGLACFNLLLHLFRIAAVEFWDDFIRVIFFIAVALCVGILSEKVSAGEYALRSSEEKYRHIFESFFAGIIVCRNDRILLANLQFYKISGYRQPELNSRSFSALIHNEDKIIIGEKISQVAQKRESHNRFESRIVKKGGGIIWSDGIISTTQYENNPAVLIHIQDITKEKKNEEERRKLIELSRQQQEQLVHSVRLAEMGELAASVAHELNQPLTGIRTFANNAIFMLDENAGSVDEVKQNLVLISKQTDRAKRIITQMRELTRKTDLRFEPLDLNKTIREIVEFLKPQLELSRIEVTMLLFESLPRIMGDQIRLEQVFLNLIMNARRAMEESMARRLEIKSYLEDDMDRVVVDISDSGQGFLQETAEKLFIPFYTTKKSGEGTGLGLPIALKIIEAHNGRIDAFGIPGKGAKFVVKLPFIH
jgi:PAS domain S-box-containing protein